LPNDSWSPASTTISLSLVVFGASACDSCRGSHPYTPYSLDSNAPGASAAPSAAGAGAPVASFAVVAGTPPAGDGAKWTIDTGIIARAPAGRTFAVGLLIDADGDGQRDLLAWARSPDGLRGELWFAPAAKPDAGRTVGALPGDLSIVGCSPSVALAQVGAHTAALDYAVSCPHPLRGTPQRWVAAIRLGAPGPSLGLELRVAATPDGETLKVALDGADQDADGRDDVTATITLTGAPPPFVSTSTVGAEVRFFDRPTGLSRDPSEPESSLRTAASALIVDARRKASAASVPMASAGLRRLRSALCDEPSPLVTTSAGPIRCGDLRPVEDATFAEGVAALTSADPPRAVRALAALDALGPGRKKELAKLIGKSAPEAAASVVRTTAAAPAGQGAGKTGWSPLSFEPGGDLLVRTADAVVRVDHTSFAETPADVVPWPTPVAWLPDGAQARPEMPEAWVLSGVEQRCAEGTVVARVRTASGALDAVLPIAGPLGEGGFPQPAQPCKPISDLPVVPLGISGAGLLFSVGLEPLSLGAPEAGKPPAAARLSFPLTSALRPAGAARSPDGATVAVPSGHGVLVFTSGGSAKRWTGNDLALAWGCVPSNGGARIACVVGAAAAILEAR
jgi:hypothetical protein